LRMAEPALNNLSKFQGSPQSVIGMSYQESRKSSLSFSLSLLYVKPHRLAMKSSSSKPHSLPALAPRLEAAKPRFLNVTHQHSHCVSSAWPIHIWAAFGSSSEEFIRIALMPEDYIIYRRRYENNGALDWQKTYESLTRTERATFQHIVRDDSVEEGDISGTSSPKIRRLLSHHVDEAEHRHSLS